MKTEIEINELMNKMTLEEKASLCSGKDFWHLEGIERLGIPSIMVTDGPHGLRKQDGSSGDHVGLNASVPATCFPTAVTLASSWDRNLLHEVGEALGDECRQEKVSVLLGPGVNIKRNPLCGRNFEYFSEDPYIGGELASSFIKGVQSKGIGTSMKHFAANNQEYCRMSIDTIVDERTMRELYLSGFEKAVKDAQPWTVMNAYNKINGEFCSDNKYLLTDILKEEWGHKGLVVTDWGATNDRVAGLKAGLELEMPGSRGINDKKIVEAVKNGTLEESILNDRVKRLLTLIFQSEEILKDTYTYDKEAHHQLAKKVASESIVLLKNEDNLLPLEMNGKIAIIGDFAETPRYQGAGSSQINPTKIDSALESARLLSGKNLEITYAKGFSTKQDKLDQSLINEALKTAESADYTIIFAGLPPSFESEGFDRKHMNLPGNQLILIEKILERCPQSIIVLSNGSPVEMPFINKCKTLIEAYLTGQAGGSAVIDIIFGKTIPCGKIAETFPVNLKDIPSNSYFPGTPKQVEYREGLYVGYRYFDSFDKEVLFPFGHGLSYTNFSYSDLKISSSKMNSGEKLTVSCKVKNTGKYDGK
nr:glycoside hydrolase family 3 C-terminal domain-containing protein [Spirochaetaceae bacterium]